jgi:hypothetical protein
MFVFLKGKLAINKKAVFVFRRKTKPLIYINYILSTNRRQLIISILRKMPFTWGRVDPSCGTRAIRRRTRMCRDRGAVLARHRWPVSRPKRSLRSPLGRAASCLLATGRQRCRSAASRRCCLRRPAQKRRSLTPLRSWTAPAELSRSSRGSSMSTPQKVAVLPSLPHGCTG